MNNYNVAHFIRGFLRPTETFIANQIINLERYTPTVFAHHRIIGHSYPEIQVNVLLDNNPNIMKKIESFYYTIFRALTPYGAKTLAQQVNKSNPKILHFHYFVEARFFLPVIKRLNLPTVVSGYGWDVSSFPKKYYGYGKKYLKPIFQQLDLFLAMSEDMKKDIIAMGCPPNKVIVHYYGTDTKKFIYPSRKYIYRKKIKILFCGRLAHKKAPQLILFSLKKLEDQNIDLPQWQLNIVGDGPLKNNLEDIVRQYRWEEKVIFYGHIPHHDDRLVDQYKSADIYIQPSMTVNDEKEGIPGTLVEAMASGLPVISSYHAGIPSIVTNNVSGLLIKEGDVGGLTIALKNLMDNVSLRQRFGSAATEFASHKLDITAKTKELETIYDHFL